MFTEHFLNALSYHPDRLSSRFIRRLALWVAPSAFMIETSFHEILKSKIHELKKNNKNGE
ncbi:MAG: hypothetical protein WAV86_12815 [Lutibacter sp.]